MHSSRAFPLILAALWSCCAATDSRAAGFSVHFNQDVYYVSGPGQQITAHISLDTNPATPEDDAVAMGLYSMSLGLTYPNAKAAVLGAGDVDVPAELEFFGFVPGAFRELLPGAAGVKGNVDQFAIPLELYHDTRLATFTITNLASAPDSYLLGLNFFNTVGPDEQFYLDGSGAVLDSQIMFGSALVIVVPEPGVGIASSALVLWFACMRRRPARTWRPAAVGRVSKLGRFLHPSVRGFDSRGVVDETPHTTVAEENEAIASTTVAR